jgi:hypothetical protein
MKRPNMLEAVWSLAENIFGFGCSPEFAEAPRVHLLLGMSDVVNEPAQHRAYLEDFFPDFLDMLTIQMLVGV